MAQEQNQRNFTARSLSVSSDGKMKNGSLASLEIDEPRANKRQLTLDTTSNYSLNSYQSYGSSRLTIEIPTNTANNSPNASPRHNSTISPRPHMDCLDWTGITIISIFTLIVIVSYFLSDFSSRILLVIFEWFQRNTFYGYIIFLLLYIGTVIIPVPIKAVISIAAGFFYGILGGLVLVYLGSTIGSLIAFVLGRCLCSDLLHKYWQLILARRVYKFSGMSVKAIGFLLVSEPFRTILCLRLTPIPMEFTNYLAATSDVPFQPFALATLLGRLVGGSNVNVFIGANLSALTAVVANSEKRILPTLITTGVLWIFAMLLGYYLYGKAKEWLREQEVNAPIRSGVDIFLSSRHAINKAVREASGEDIPIGTRTESTMGGSLRGSTMRDSSVETSRARQVSETISQVNQLEQAIMLTSTSVLTSEPQARRI